jgi:hypothetical protein
VSKRPTPTLMTQPGKTDDEILVMFNRAGAKALTRAGYSAGFQDGHRRGSSTLSRGWFATVCMVFCAAGIAAGVFLANFAPSAMATPSRVEQRP